VIASWTVGWLGLEAKLPESMYSNENFSGPGIDFLIEHGVAKKIDPH
jgi:hypothetical protein